MKKYISKRSRKLRALLALYVGVAVMALALSVAVGTASASEHPYTPPTGQFCVDGATVSVSGFAYLFDSFVAEHSGTYNDFGYFTFHPTVYHPGAAHTVAAGACVIVEQIDRTGFCTASGEFLNLDFATYLSDVAGGEVLTPSPYVSGVGLTCNTAGTTYAGYSVDGDTGLAKAYQPDNIHELFTAAP